MWLIYGFSVLPKYSVKYKCYSFKKKKMWLILPSTPFFDAKMVWLSLFNKESTSLVPNRPFSTTPRYLPYFPNDNGDVITFQLIDVTPFCLVLWADKKFLWSLSTYLVTHPGESTRSGLRLDFLLHTQYWHLRTTKTQQKHTQYNPTGLTIDTIVWKTNEMMLPASS